MSWKSVREFLQDQGIPKTILKDLTQEIQNLEDNNLQVMVIDPCNYIWSHNGKYVLTKLSSLSDRIRDDTERLRKTLRVALSRSNCRDRVKFNANLFLKGTYCPSESVILMVTNNFRVSQIEKMSDMDFFEYFDQVSKNMGEIITNFHNKTTGLCLIELESFVVWMRHALYRHYKAISKSSPGEYMESELVKIPGVRDIEEHCRNVLVWATEAGNRRIVSIMKFIVTLCEYYKISHVGAIQYLRGGILAMVKYKSLSRARPPKRPRVKVVKKKTWRDKRPPRIKTDLPVYMPDVALKIKRVQKKLKRNFE